MKLMMHLLFKLCRAQKMLLDNCAGPSVTVKTCLHVPEDHQFVRDEKDSACFKNARPSLVGMYMKLVLNVELYIVESDEAAEKRNVFVKNVPAVTSGRKDDRWTVQLNLFMCR